MKKIVATTTVQKGRSLYINIPKKIAEEMQLEKGETALFTLVDKNTMKITIIED